MGDEETRQYLEERKKSYQLTFDMNQPADQFVIEDLCRFCRGEESCAVPGDRDRTFMLLGRQEVYHRIMQHLGLNPEQLFSLYSGNTPRQRTK